MATPQVELRPYQSEAVVKLFEAFPDNNRILVSMPTGVGKTVVGMYAATVWPDACEALGLPPKVLWLAHREELVFQAVTQFRNMSGEEAGVEKAYDTVTSRPLLERPRVVAASIQTLFSEERRLLFAPDEFGLIVMDECVDGLAAVETELGTIPLSEAVRRKAKRVLTHDGTSAKFGRIEAWASKGRRAVLRVATYGGTIRVTGEHPIWTLRGWVEARHLKPGDAVVRAVAAYGYRQSTPGGDRESAPLVIRHPEVAKNGRLSTKNLRRHCRFVSVAAALALRQTRVRYHGLLNGVAREAFQGIAKATISGRPGGRSRLRLTSGRRFSGRYSATLASAYRTHAVRTPGYPGTIQASRRSGFATRPLSSGGCRHRFRLRPILGTATSCVRFGQVASRVCCRSMISPDRTAAPKSYRGHGLTRWGHWGSRGGSAMTAVVPPDGRLHFTLRALTTPVSGLWQCGFELNTARYGSPSHAEAIKRFTFAKRSPARSRLPSGRTCRPAWHISCDTVLSVDPDGSREVYDLAVADTHCFFANGILVHNCHHGVAPAWQEVADYFDKGRLVGLTATTDRADEVSLGQMFGSVPFHYSLPDAIKDGYLSKIKQEYIRVESLDFSGIKLEDGDLSVKAVEDRINREQTIHELCAPVAKLAGDRQTIIFTPSVGSAESVAALMSARYSKRGAVAVSGSTNPDDRKAAVEAYLRGDIQFLVNCGVFLEGFDAPNTSCIVIARPTASRALYAQMIGRGLRGGWACPIEGKEDCLVLDLTGKAADHRLVGSPDLLAGNYDKAVTDEIRRRMEEKGEDGEPNDVDEIIAECVASSDELRKMAFVKVVADAKLSRKTIDPFSLLDVAEEALPGWWDAKQPLPEQIDKLEAAGIRHEGDFDYASAQKLCHELDERRAAGLCTYKQAKQLAIRGFDPHMSFDAAGVVLDYLATRPGGFGMQGEDYKRKGYAKKRGRLVSYAEVKHLPRYCVPPGVKVDVRAGGSGWKEFLTKKRTAFHKPDETQGDQWLIEQGDFTLRVSKDYVTDLKS